MMTTNNNINVNSCNIYINKYVLSITINILHASIPINDVARKVNSIRWQWSFKLRLLLQKAFDWATKTSSLDDDNDNLPKIDASAEKTPK